MQALRRLRQNQPQHPANDRERLFRRLRQHQQNKLPVSSVQVLVGGDAHQSGHSREVGASSFEQFVSHWRANLRVDYVEQFVHG